MNKLGRREIELLTDIVNCKIQQKPTKSIVDITMIILHIRSC